MSPAAEARELRVERRLETRGFKGLGRVLVGLRGARFGDHWELGCLYAVGAEGAVFLAKDVRASGRESFVAKVALHPYHRPFQLSFDSVKAQRARLREEARRLEQSASPYMPRFEGLHEFVNPLFDARRGGVLAEREPVFVMERLPGFDLDRWLLRVHRSGVPRAVVRRHVDHVAVVVLRALWDLHERGFIYCDLRPGNIRIRGRSQHRVRLFDAGSLVPRANEADEFPHVPAYLPPDLFARMQREGPEVLVPDLKVQAVMAGRTLHEVATARVPVPGMPVNAALMRLETVSPEVAEVIRGLCEGEYASVFEALSHLATISKESVDATPQPAPARTKVAVGAIHSGFRPAAAEKPQAAPSRKLDLATVLEAARASADAVPAPAPQRPVPVGAAVAAVGEASSTATPAVPLPTEPAAARAERPQTSRPPAGRRHVYSEDPILPEARPRTFWRRILDKITRRR